MWSLALIFIVTWQMHGPIDCAVVNKDTQRIRRELDLDPASMAKNAAEAADKAVDVVNKLSNMFQASFERGFKELDTKPQDLVSEAAMEAALSKIGNKDLKEIIFHPMPGFSGEDRYQGSGWTLSAKGEPEPDDDDENEKDDVPVIYKGGAGYAMLSGCFLTHYEKDSPCHKLIEPAVGCGKHVQEGANFLGVGFDGRGYYSSESRRSSIIQRTCKKNKMYHGRKVPDVMTIYGIYDYDVSTHTYNSEAEYIENLQERSETSKTSKMFAMEKSSVQTTTQAKSGFLGFLGASKGSSSGSSQSTKNSKSSSQRHSSSSSSTSRKKSHSFMAVCEANLKLFEIALDVVTPDDFSQPFLRDFNSLPLSWHAVNAMNKYQAFVLRYGSHYVTSAKFGGQMKIKKTTIGEKSMTKEAFAQQAQSEISSMFSQTRNSHAKEEESTNFFGSGDHHKDSIQTGSASSKSSSASSSEGSFHGKSSQSSSDEMNTELKIQGGSQQMAKAVMDFYSPNFRSDFVEWLESIPDSPRPYEFTLRKMSEILDVNSEILFSNKTTNPLNTTQIDEKMNSFKEKRFSLQRAEIIYMSEGAFDTNSFEVKGGNMACETNYLDLDKEENKPETWPTWSDMMDDTKTFKIEFSLPHDLSILENDDELILRSFGSNGKQKMWLYKEPGGSFDMNHACNTETEAEEKLICVANLEMSYDEETGILTFHEDTDYRFYFDEKNNITIDSIDFRQGLPIARATKMDDDQVDPGLDQYYKVPCSVEWKNNQRVDPLKPNNCIYFSASTAGSLYLVFAEIPAEKKLWYYLHITSKKVFFYEGMKLKKSVHDIGVGNLGDDDLYESYVVCLTQGKKKNITLMYGKTSGQMGQADIKAVHTFEQSENKRLTFFSFGTGHGKLQIDDVRIEQALPNTIECPKGYTKWSEKVREKTCKIQCHKNCNEEGCREPNDETACYKCQNFTNYEDDTPFCVKSCPAGKEANPHNECTICKKGTYYDGQKKKCLACPEGQYQNKMGATNCLECPLGQYSPVKGREHCLLCVPEYYANQTGSTSCKKCENTTGWNEIDSNLWGRAYCDNACKPGTYYNDEIDISGKCCEDNCFNYRGTLAKSVYQRNCVDWRFTTFKHYWNKEDYAKYGLDSNYCRNPPIENEFKGSNAWCFVKKENSDLEEEDCDMHTCNGSEKCLKAPPGEMAHTYAMHKTVKCPIGHYQDQSGQKQCKACEKGTYADTEGSVSCRKCSLHHYQNKEGQNTCQECEKGEMTMKRGSKKCIQKCKKGHYHDATDGQNCIACPPGTYGPAEGLRKCNRCQLGKVQRYKGQVSCIEDAKFRLVDKSKISGTNGTLEVLHQGKWSTVCYDKEHQNVASIICANLGWPEPLTSKLSSGNTYQMSAWSKLKCDKDKTDIFSCSHKNPTEKCKPIIITCSEKEPLDYDLEKEGFDVTTIHKRAVKYFEEALSWDEAQTSCESLEHPGNLLTVNVKTVAKFIEEVNSDFWIGAKKEYKRIYWKLDGSLADELTQKTVQDIDGNCIAANANSNKTYGAWRCDYKKPFVCEIYL